MLSTISAPAKLGGRQAHVMNLDHGILDRYERRAYSRRTRALRLLTARFSRTPDVERAPPDE